MVSKNSMSKINTFSGLLTLRETSKILNVHPNTLRQWDNRGILKAVRFGQRKDRRYRKDDVLALLDKN